MAFFKKTGRVAAELPECPVCIETMTPPIFQCLSGHSICSGCTKKLCPPLCPICRMNMTQMRNWALEDILNQAKTSSSCPNIGCKFNFPPDEKEEHIKECIYRVMKCPMRNMPGNCSWTGKLQEMMNHFKERHARNCNVQQDTDIFLDDISTDKDGRHFFLIQNDFNILFMITVKIDTLSKTAYWIIQLIGAMKAAQQHIYHLQINSRVDERRKIVFSEHCFNDTITADEVIGQQGKCPMIPLAYLNHFIKDKRLSFRLHIKRTLPIPFKGRQDKTRVLK